MSTEIPLKKSRLAKHPSKAASTVDLKEIPPDGDRWESFTRDFLVALGFVVDAVPNRGPDGGKDLIVVEHLSGKLNRYPLRWMVSCKHKAHSGKAVSEAEEGNLLERLKSVKCDAFIGVYSTLPTSGLAERLRNLRDNGSIRDFRVFDAGLIDNHLVGLGFTTLLLRYLPESYKRLKPLHALTGEYVPLTCVNCGRDMLEATAVATYVGLVAFVKERRGLREIDEPEDIIDLYWACKGDCDMAVEASWTRKGCSVGWEDISDIAIPAWYLTWTFNTMNGIRSGRMRYETEAYEKLKQFITAMSQRVLREMTEEERLRFNELLELPML